MESGSFKLYLRSIALFLLARYPLCQALTLLLFIAEKVHDNSLPPFPPYAIYTFIALMFICSVGMGISSLTPLSSVATSILIFLSAGVILFNESLHYRRWVKIRIACGMIGVAATFLFFAYFNCRKPRPQLLRRMAELLLAIFSALVCYILINSPEDKDSFLHLVPFGHTMLFVYVLLMGASSLSYLIGIHVFDFNLVICALCLFKLFAVDVHMSYWHNKRGIDYWNQIRMIIDNAAIAIGSIFYSTCFKRIEIEHNKID